MSEQNAPVDKKLLYGALGVLAILAFSLVAVGYMIRGQDQPQVVTVYEKVPVEVPKLVYVPASTQMPRRITIKPGQGLAGVLGSNDHAYDIAAVNRLPVIVDGKEISVTRARRINTDHKKVVVKIAPGEYRLYRNNKLERIGA